MAEPWNDGVRGTQVPPLINSDADTIRCVAGPGSGKTFGLVRRVERLLHPGGLAIDGSDVLVVAFTLVYGRLPCQSIDQISPAAFERRTVAKGMDAAILTDA
jgi:hypothetical protein